MNTMIKNTGLTLVELLITLTIVSIVIGIAVPNFSSLVKTNALTAQTNYFTAAISLARSEAVKQDAQILMCVRNGSTCSNTANWEDGWIIFNDSDGNLDVNDGEAIRIFDSLPNGFSIRPDDANLTTLAFNSDGRASTIGNIFSGTEFSLCDPSGSEDFARTLSMNIAGRIRLAEGVDSCP